MWGMREKRKNERTELQSKLLIKRLDGSDEKQREETIDIIDVSRAGIGFSCKMQLGVCGVYEAYLKIWTQEILHTFLQIVRMKQENDIYKYGAVFIGMSEMDASRIATYQTVNNHEK